MADITHDGGLDDVRRLRAAARRDRQAWPFALVVLGVVVLLAAPFYVLRPVTARAGTSELGVDVVGPLGTIGTPRAVLGAWAGPYWVAALVVAGLLIARHYRRAAARRGIAGPVWPLVTTGLVLVVLLVLWTPRLLLAAGPSTAMLVYGAVPLWSSGLTPLLVIALGVVVLAWTERSGALAAVAACYLAVAVAANLDDLPSLGLRGPTPGRFDLLPSLLLPGLVLLVAGIVAAAVRRRSR